MTKETEVRIRSITAKAALKFGSEAWMLKKDEQRLEATEMKFLGQLLGITKLDRDRNLSLWDKPGVQNTVREIEEYRPSGYSVYREWTQTGYPSRHFNTDLKGRDT